MTQKYQSSQVLRTKALLYQKVRCSVKKSNVCTWSVYFCVFSIELWFESTYDDESDKHILSKHNEMRKTFSSNLLFFKHWKKHIHSFLILVFSAIHFQKHMKNFLNLMRIFSCYYVILSKLFKIECGICSHPTTSNWNACKGTKIAWRYIKIFKCILTISRNSEFLEFPLASLILIYKWKIKNVQYTYFWRVPACLQIRQFWKCQDFVTLTEQFQFFVLDLTSWWRRTS